MNATTKLIIGLVVVVLIGAGAYFALNKGGVIGKETYSNKELGFSFAYRGGASGYELKEAKATDEMENGFKTNIVMMLKTDAEELRKSQAAREGPPTLGVMVFKNVSNFTGSEWAEHNPSYSNYGAQSSNIRDFELDGAKATRYLVDGLYHIDTVVVTKGQFVYVFTGAYQEDTSRIKSDFDPLLSSVKFTEGP